MYVMLAGQQETFSGLECRLVQCEDQGTHSSDRDREESKIILADFLQYLFGWNGHNVKMYNALMHIA